MPRTPHLLILSALAGCVGTAAWAQAGPQARVQPADDATPASSTPPPQEGQGEQEIVKPGDIIDFQSDTLSYDDRGDIVTATGAVVVQRDAYRLRADKAIWNRKTGEFTATGNVVVVDPQGNQAFGDNAKIDDTLKNAAMDNMLLVLESGGRLAAQSGRRVDGVSTLNRGVYSPCAVEDGCGLKTTPVWQIKALRIVHNPGRNRVFYESAWLEIAGVPVLYLPRFSNPDKTTANSPGFLTPDLRIARAQGFTLITPYYIPLGPDQDVTISPRIYAAANPALEADYRKLTSLGPFQIGGIGTLARAFTLDRQGNEIEGTGDILRGYVYANGQFQLSPSWRATFSFRGTSDDTFLRRYDISQEDVLRSVARIERFETNSYFSVEGWAFQGLRPTDRGGLTPIAIPLVTYRWTPDWKPLGFTLDVLGNTQAITRTTGEDNQRALGQVRTSQIFTTVWGQRITLTGQVRADAYHASETERPDLSIYAGENGWHGRVIPLAAVDVAWPFFGPALSGVQTITPRVQLVSSPYVTNSVIPNEDARAIDLDDTNIFSLNRFPGYDRWEGGTRVTYGLNYTLEVPRLRLMAEAAQSYRLNDRPDLFPLGTGLTNKFSDIVGRVAVRYGRFVDLTYRFRFDQANLALRKTDVDLTLGTNRSFVQLAYIRLNRNILIEDLRDREELRATARLQFRRYWSVFGAAILDLTSKSEDPLAQFNGFQPIRHRFGVAYEDECFALALTWRRDYVNDIAVKAGDSFQFRITFKNLGR
ncbi:MAG: LPS assembly protein LptD [Sphingomonadaceae bacterium]|nr:LPS assembly protein LptD [Sphingomonadaceae bacterium]